MKSSVTDSQRNGEMLDVSPFRKTLSSLYNSFLESAGPKWILTLLDQAVVSTAAFLTGIIIGRACGKEQFGLYLLGMTIVFFLYEIQNVLIWSPYTLFSSRLTGKAHARYTGSSLLHQLAFSVPGIAFLLAMGACPTFGLVPPGLVPIIWPLVIASVFINLQSYSRQICFAGLFVNIALVLDGITAVFQVLGLLLLVYLGILSTAGAFVVMGLSCGLASLGWLLWARRKLTFSASSALSDLKKNWSFGKWILGGNMAIYFSSQLYPWLLAAFWDTATVGILAACQGVVALANPVLLGSRNFIAPKAARAFAQGGYETLRAFVIRNTVVLVAGVGGICAIIIVYGGRLAVLIYGPQYAGQELVVGVLGLQILFVALSFVVDYGIWAMEKPDINFKINAVRLLVTLVFGIWLVRALGPLGVALGLVCGSLAVCLLQYAFFFTRPRGDEGKP